MIDLNIDDGGDLGVLTLKEDVTIVEAEKLKEALLEGLKSSKQLLVELNELTGLDLTCLQLIYSAKKSFSKEDKVFTLSGKFPEIFKETIKNAGYLNEFNNEELYQQGGNK